MGLFDTIIDALQPVINPPNTTTSKPGGGGGGGSSFAGGGAGVVVTTGSAGSVSTASNSKTLAGQLALAGFTFPFSISDFIDRALRAGVDDPFSYAYALILKSKRFRNYYPGIFRANGTLKMSPAEYEAYVDSARAGARSAGFSITRRQVGSLIANNVSADEYAFRIKAAQQIKANTSVLDAFNRRLKSQGLQPLKSADAIFDFFTRRGNKRVYDVYEASALEGLFKEAGLSLTPSRAANIAKDTIELASVEELREKAGGIASALTEASPELASFLDRRGVEPQKALEIIAFGLSRAGELRPLIEQALKQREAQIKTQTVTQAASVTQTGRPLVGTAPAPGF